MPEITIKVPNLWRRKAASADMGKGGTATSLASDVSQMAQQALRASGSQGLSQMGPGEGLASAPLDASQQPRTFQYRPGWNLPTSPGEGRISYQTLRGVADSYDVARKAIEIRKDELASLPFDIVPRALNKQEQRKLMVDKADAIKRVKDRFLRPDGRLGYQAWLRKGLEDYFVLDAMSLSTQRNLGGDVIAWKWIDGGTVKPRIDVTGEVPMRPGVGYQQYLYGRPVFDFFESDDPMEYLEAVQMWRRYQAELQSSEMSYLNTGAMGVPGNPGPNRIPPGELRYRPRNRRNHTVYGFSHVESFLVHTNIALRWQLWEQSFWSDGNIPSAMVSVPDDWTSQQIEEYQMWWDALIAGDPSKQRSLRFIPGGSKVFDTEASLEHSTDFAQWLLTITLMIFDLNRSEVGLDPLNGEGLGGKGHAEGQAQQQVRASLRPTAQWLKQELFDSLIQNDMGETDLEWVWPTLMQENEREQGEVNQILLFSGQKSLDEIISEQGGDPIGVGRMILQGSQLLFEPDLIKANEQGFLGMQQEQAQQLAEHQAGVQQDSAEHQSGLNKDEAEHGADLQQDQSKLDAKLQPKPAPATKKSAGSDCGCGCALTKMGRCSDPACGCDCESCHPGIGKAVAKTQAAITALDDLSKWERKAVAAYKRGKSPAVTFKSDALDTGTRWIVESGLSKATLSDDIRGVFRQAREIVSGGDDDDKDGSVVAG